MKIIGLCGGSGSGKGTVSVLFAEYEIPSIDTDKVYHELTASESSCLIALINEFGNEIISKEGSLDRKKLGRIVFSGEDSHKKLKKLNEISHKYVLDETRRRLDFLREQGYKCAIVDAPVLFESGFDKECDLTVAVLCDKEMRISRIISRDNISYEAASARIRSQISDEELVKRCNFIIYNNSDLDALKQEVKKTVNHIFNY